MADPKYIEFFDAVTSVGINTSRRGFLPAGRYYGFDTYVSPNLTHTNTVKYLGNDNTTQEDRAALVSQHGTVVFFDQPSTHEVLSLLTLTADSYQVIYFQFLWDNTPGGSTYSFTSGAVLGTEPVLPAPSAVLTETPVGYFTYDGAGAISSYTPYPAPFLGRDYLDIENLAYTDETNEFEKSNYSGVQYLNHNDLINDTDAGWNDGTWSRLQVGDGGNIVYVDLSGATGAVKISDIDNPGATEGDNILVIFVGAPTDSIIKSSSSKIITQDLSTGDTGTPINILSVHGFYSLSAGQWVEYSQTTAMGRAVASLQSRVSANELQLTNHENRITQLESVTGLTWVDLTPIADSLGSIQYAIAGDVTYIIGSIVWPLANGSDPAFTLYTGSVPIGTSRAEPCGVHGDVPANAIGYASVFITSTGITLGIEFKAAPTSNASVSFSVTVQTP